MAQQTSTSLIPQDGQITHLAFNHHGTTLASSSLDHTVRITSLNSQTGLWESNPVQFKAHDSPVLKVVWGNPEFGTVLATCGTDGEVKIWLEEEAVTSRTAGGGTTATTTGQGHKKWTQKVVLTDCRGSVRDIEFSPAEFGLKLAAVSSDSHLRLWECLDPVSLTEWTLIEDIDLGLLPVTPSGAGLDKRSSASGVQLLAGGAEMGNNAQTSSAATMGSGNSLGEGRKNGTVESDGGWSLSWCKEAWWGEHLAVTSGSSGIIRLFHLPDHAPWSNYLNLIPPRNSSSSSSYSLSPPPVSSLCWAPSSGRSYQLLASGSRDGRARIWKLVPPSLDDDANDGEWKGELDAELDSGSGSARANGSVGRVKVDWNLTGTVLSTGGDDGRVRLWKATWTGLWQTLAVLTAEEDKSDTAMA